MQEVTVAPKVVKTKEFAKKQVKDCTTEAIDLFKLCLRFV